MSAPDISEIPAAQLSHSRRRKLLLIGGILVLFLGFAIGWYFYVTTAAEKRLQAAIAEADRLDPGWRFEEIEAKRQVIPDEENAARKVILALQLMDARVRPSLWASQQALFTELENLAPEIQVNERQHALLQAEVAKLANPLAEARKLADMPCGKYPITWSRDAYSTFLPDVQDSRSVGSLLMMDVTLKLQENNGAAALTAWRALFNTSRAVGDEPLLVAQFVRMALRGIALGQLERMLAHMQLSEAKLADLQEMLQEEESQPILLIGARGERAAAHRFMEALKAGDAKISTMAGPGISSFLGIRNSALDELGYSALAGSKDNNHAAILETLTEFVEIVKLPLEQQNSRLQALFASVRDQPFLARRLFPAMQKLSGWFQRNQAALRSAIVAMAVERYRCKQQRWPDSFIALVPEYLRHVPVDPHDGEWLRYRRLDHGVVIYSVGPDRQDNGGNITRNPLAPGSDIGFRLWNMDKRRQPPTPAVAAETSEKK